MNRPIKFRAWDITDKRLYPVEQWANKSWVAVPIQDTEDDWHLEQRKLDAVTLEQFTGLLDKNGKEQYEMDIIRAGGCTFAVLWDARSAAFRYVDSAGNSESPLNYDDPEVIGNIHETPDLLK